MKVRRSDRISGALTLFWLALPAAILGCAGLFGGAPDPRVAKFECHVAALAPVVGDVFDTGELVRDAYAGKANVDDVLRALGATQAELEQVLSALAACEKESVVVAPPPAYGNKVVETDAVILY